MYNVIEYEALNIRVYNTKTKCLNTETFQGFQSIQTGICTHNIIGTVQYICISNEKLTVEKSIEISNSQYEVMCK